MSAVLTLDKFKLLWLAEGAIGKSHLRWDIYEIFVNDIYPQLNDNEREFIYTYLKRDLSWMWEGKYRDETAYQYWLQMLERYNPTNRFELVLDDDNGHKENVYDAYMWNDRYYVDWNRYCCDDYIQSVKKKEQSQKTI